MVDKYLEGIDVVYGVCNSWEMDFFFKWWIVLVYYGLMKCLGVNFVLDFVDYCLFSKWVMEVLF